MKERDFETKRLAVEAYNKGVPPKQLAQIFQVHPRTIFRWLSSLRTGKTNNSPRGHRTRSLGPEAEDKLEALVLAKPGSTIDELCQAMGHICERTTIHRTLVRLGYRFKKTLKADQQNRPDMASAREQ